MAISIPADLREEFTAEARHLNLPGGRIGKPENVHLTLKFLGNTSEDLLPEIAAALSRIAGLHSVFELSPGKFGAFPSSRRPRVIWIGLDGGARETIVLQNDIEEGMTGLGFPADDRFHPHITIVRFKFPRPAENDISVIEPPWLGRAVEVADIVLYRSKLSSQGPTYTAIERFPLVRPER